MSNLIISEKLKKEAKRQIREESISKKLQFIEHICGEITKHYKNIDIEALTVKLVECAEKLAEAEANFAIKVGEEMQDIINTTISDYEKKEMH